MIHLNIGTGDLELMLSGYMRYSLGRQSYIVGACCKTLRDYVPSLPKTTIKRFIEEIVEELDHDKRTIWRNEDREDWTETVDYLRSKL